MRVAIRADASTTMGAGHVMRCLALADALRDKGAEVLFLCRTLPGNLLEQIEKCGYPAKQLETMDWAGDAKACLNSLHDFRPDWLVLDHYQLDTIWENQLRSVASYILAIDDMAKQRHDCDILLNQNLSTSDQYATLVPPATELLLGPYYALLRGEFQVTRTEVRSGQIRRVLVFFGGSDPTNETEKVIDAIENLDLSDIQIDVVVGSGNQQRERLEQRCLAMPNVHFHCQVNNMAMLMAQADLALGAAGVASWERLAMKLPALLVAVADNQRENMRQLDQLGVAVGLGISTDVAEVDMVRAISSLLSDPTKIRNMSLKAAGMVDGKGANRVTERLMARVRR